MTLSSVVVVSRCEFGVDAATFGLKVALIEAVPVNRTAHPSFDERTTALSNGSRRVFEALNVWPSIQRGATASNAFISRIKGGLGLRVICRRSGLAA